MNTRSRKMWERKMVDGSALTHVLPFGSLTHWTVAQIAPNWLPKDLFLSGPRSLNRTSKNV